MFTYPQITPFATLFRVITIPSRKFAISFHKAATVFCGRVYEIRWRIYGMEWRIDEMDDDNPIYGGKWYNEHSPQV